MVDEPPLALALLETLDCAIALLAPNTKPTSRQGDNKLLKIFIAISYGNEVSLCMYTAAQPRIGGDDSKQMKFSKYNRRIPAFEGISF